MNEYIKGEWGWSETYDLDTIYIPPTYPEKLILTFDGKYEWYVNDTLKDKGRYRLNEANIVDESPDIDLSNAFVTYADGYIEFTNSNGVVQQQKYMFHGNASRLTFCLPESTGLVYKIFKRTRKDLSTN